MQIFYFILRNLIYILANLVGIRDNALAGMTARFTHIRGNNHRPTLSILGTSQGCFIFIPN